MPFRKSKSVVEVPPGGTVYKIYLVDNNIVWYLQYKLSHQFKDTPIIPFSADNDLKFVKYYHMIHWT